MLLHLIKLLLEFLTIGYSIVITGYAINKAIRKNRYKCKGRTANDAWLTLAELIKKEERYYRRAKAALQDNDKNKSIEISSNVVEQQFNSVNTKWKQKRFPLLKTVNSFFIYSKLFAATKSFTKNHNIDFVLFSRDKMHHSTFLKNHQVII